MSITKRMMELPLNEPQDIMTPKEAQRALDRLHRQYPWLKSPDPDQAYCDRDAAVRRKRDKRSAMGLPRA
jgi:hypothetical protein